MHNDKILQSHGLTVQMSFYIKAQTFVVRCPQIMSAPQFLNPKFKTTL